MQRILVVVDIQNDFVDGALGTDEAVEIIDNAVEKINTFEGKIVVTYDTHNDAYLYTSEGRKLPVKHCIKGTYGWELNEKIKDALIGRDYICVEKPTFGSVELADVIKNIAGDEDFSVELIGLCTDICVVSNALILKANFPENNISVCSACCAGVTPESHEAALLTMKMCQIEVK